MNTTNNTTERRNRHRTEQSGRTSTVSVLIGAEKRLRRFAKRRATNDSKKAYRDAATLVHDLAKKIG